jgi:hypothetical protein
MPVEGPRLGTKAESHFLRLAGCDLVGMTNVPQSTHHAAFPNEPLSTRQKRMLDYCMR